MYVAPVNTVYIEMSFVTRQKKNKQLLSQNHIQIKLFASYSVKKL